MSVELGGCGSKVAVGGALQGEGITFLSGHGAKPPCDYSIKGQG